MSIVNAVGIILSSITMYLAVTQTIVPFELGICEIMNEPTCSYFSRDGRTYVELRIPILDHTTGRKSDMIYINEAVYINMPCDPKPWFSLSLNNIPRIGKPRIGKGAYCHFSEETQSMVFSAPIKVLFDMITKRGGWTFGVFIVGLYSAVYFGMRYFDAANLKVSRD